MSKKGRLLAAVQVGGPVVADLIFEAAARMGDWLGVAEGLGVPREEAQRYMDEVTAQKRKATRWTDSEVEIIKEFVRQNMTSKEKKNYQELQGKIPGRSIKALRTKVAEISAEMAPKMDEGTAERISQMRKEHGDNWDLIGCSLGFPDGEKMKSEYMERENDPCSTNSGLDAWFV